MACGARNPRTLAIGRQFLTQAEAPIRPRFIRRHGDREAKPRPAWSRLHPNIGTRAGRADLFVAAHLSWLCGPQRTDDVPDDHVAALCVCVCRFSKRRGMS